MDDVTPESDAIQDHRLGPGWMLLLAVWAGLAGGLLEAADFAKKRFVDGAVIQAMPDDVLWAASIADVVLCLLLALLLLAVARFAPQVARPRVVLTIFVAFACLAPLLWIKSIAWWAALVLALGIGETVSRVAAPRWRWTRRVVAGSLPLLVLAVVGAAGLLASRRAAESEAAAVDVPVADAGAPNVVLIVLDTVNTHHMSSYGYERATTPALERLADEATIFDHALATSSWTLPTHISLLAGQYRHETPAHWRGPMPRDTPTLADWLRSRGYRTAGFVGNLAYCDRTFGLNEGFDHYEDFHMHAGQIVHTSKPASAVVKAIGSSVGYHEILWRKSAEGMIERALDWVDESDDRPWFVFFNFYDAHGPYLPPRRLRDRFGPTAALSSYQCTYSGGAEHERNTYSDEQLESAVNAYDAAILYLDEQIEALLRELEARGVLDDTLIVVTSDHGEEFGEHAAIGHGVNLYDESIRVPLLLRYPPAVPRGERVDRPVTLRDVPATIQSLVAPEMEPSLPGTSLRRAWASRRESEDAAAQPASYDSLVISQLAHASHQPDWSPASQGHAYAVCVGDHTVLLNGDGSAEVYDRVADPSQQHDLATTAEGQAILAQARSLLRAHDVTGDE